MDTPTVWIAKPDALPKEALSRMWSTLSGEEKAKASRFSLERDCRAYIAARGVLRHALEKATGIPAMEVAINAPPGKKPHLDPALGLPHQFNLAHVPTVVACVVTNGVPCGIDVVDADPMDEDTKAWCVKEAYLKGVGIGLNVDPGTIAVSFEGTTPILSDAASGIELDDWHLILIKQGTTHLALSIKGEGYHNIVNYNYIEQFLDKY